jgi:manganese/iron transport system substrate-binding protein
MPPRLRTLASKALAGLLALAVAAVCLAVPAAAATEPKKPFRVVTTFTVIQDIAQRVAGTSAIVESITKPGAEIHDYQPTPLDIVKAQSADLVLWNGMNLERWFEKFFQNVQDVPSAVVTEGVEPMGIADGPYTGKPNPHAWMSPANALKYVENIRKALVAHDPANAEAYNRNAAAYAAEIKAIDEPLRKRLAAIPEGQRWLVSSEGAFSYLARDYGLKELYLWPINADEQARPSRSSASSTRCAPKRSRSCSARAPSPTSRRSRWPRKPAPATAASSTSIASAPRTDPSRPTSSCSRSPCRRLRRGSAHERLRPVLARCRATLGARRLDQRARLDRALSERHAGAA